MCYFNVFKKVRIGGSVLLCTILMYPKKVRIGGYVLTPSTVSEKLRIKPYFRLFNIDTTEQLSTTAAFRMMSAPRKSKVLDARTISDLHSVLHPARTFRVRVLHSVMKFCTLFSILIQFFILALQ